MGQPEQNEAVCRLSHPAFFAGDIIDLINVTPMQYAQHQNDSADKETCLLDKT